MKPVSHAMAERVLTDRALELTRAWCAIPSVSGNPAGLKRHADALTDWLCTDLGAEIVSAASRGGRPPLIHARLDAGAANTVILYNMYDVMPADAAAWQVPPFEGGIVDLDGIGPSFVARGAENNKGPLAGMLAVIKDLADRGVLPVNVEILLEGEEESGSGALRGYLGDPDCPVRPALGGLFPSFCEYGGGPPRLYLGFSGIAKGRIRVEGGDWGGPSAPIHSSNAPWIANPASRLVEALALFGEPPTGRLGAVELDDEARALVAELATTFDPEAELRFRKTTRYAQGGDAEALLAHVLTTASATISSLATDPAAGDAVIPRSAEAGFDLRCPPGLDPATFLEAYRARLAEARLDGVVLAVADVYPGHRFAPHSAGVAALIEAYAQTAAAPQIWPWAIGAAPAHAFAPHAGSFLIGGAGRGGNAHGVDEFLTLEGYPRFLKSVELWLCAMGRAEGGAG
ncbi:M20 family metallopeptidase [Jiella avicenniae]|uniref:M20/M25/M40 family metallo-hydrolase n=1 Tax=Jiella avicenniae TaxID=2907202 RepID=A0A9X1P2J4_9HYPH|nr:M20/M25/M40 family metallo-hydrolase [Jiella avicenniae]MCE7029333.1 M20/M25/M40 family metallo-hydrolase [Jiella avicenniae]